MVRPNLHPITSIICNAIFGVTYTAMIISDIRRESLYISRQNKEIIEYLDYLKDKRS